MTGSKLAHCLITPEASIHEAIASINQGAMGLCLMVDGQGRLVATISDGDIRRAMMAGVSLDKSVAEVLKLKYQSAHPVPVTAPAGTGSAVLLQLMQAAKVQHIPLLDDHDRVVDIALMTELTELLPAPLNAVVMAGGFGKRLRPLTESIPKPMLPVGNRPLLERTIEQLRNAGITDVKITTHYRSDAIVEHFGDGGDFGVRLDYVHEEEPLGTAGSLGLMERPSRTTLVINGDILTTVDYRAMRTFHMDHQAGLTVGVRLYEFSVPYGVVESDGVRISAIKEKPRLEFFVNAGLYLIEPTAWDFIRPGESMDMPELIGRMVAAGATVISFPIREYWLDIGKPDDYQRAQVDIAGLQQ